MVRSYPELLDEIRAIDPVAYAATRNHVAGAVTRLSPYITRGVLPLTMVRDIVLERHPIIDCEKLLQELAWREYFQNIWWAKGDAIFSDLRFSRSDWRHDELVAGIVRAETGIEAIDAAVQELYTTGYLHNQVRLWVASLACNLARAHWYPMGKWLYYHLLDGDLASNFCSWQWVAGTLMQKRYTFTQPVVNRCTESSQSGTYLDIPPEHFARQPIPPALQASLPFTYETLYPATDRLARVAGQEVLLYTPWTLDPCWRSAASPARRILVIDPAWFDRFPVSELALDFIIRQGQTVLPQLEVHVGGVSDIPGIAEAATVTTLAHPSNLTWDVSREAPARLFPAVTGYYPSFSAYWRVVRAHYQLDGTPKQS